MSFSTLNVPTVPCLAPGLATTQTACSAIPNSVWVPSSSSTTQGTPTGTCLCCGTDGTAFANPAATSSANACFTCSGQSCGGGNGYCSPNDGTCTQNPTTKKFTPCTSNSGCSGGCNGSCGAGEWFLFQKCGLSNTTGSNTYSCNFDIGQWRSWVTWILIVLFLILIIWIIWAATRKRKIKRETVLVQSSATLQQPTYPPGSYSNVPVINYPLAPTQYANVPQKYYLATSQPYSPPGLNPY